MESAYPHAEKAAAAIGSPPAQPAAAAELKTSKIMRLLDFGGLSEKGIRFSDTHIWRLIKAGQFPQPMRIGRRAYWSEAEIDGFIEEKLARRSARTEV